MEEEVGNLLDVVSSMEEGDLTVEAQVNDRATGLVADTLNRLREKLIEVISSVLGTAQQVAQGASDLEALAQTVMLNTAEQAQSVAQGQALTAQVAAIAKRSSEQVSVANQSLQGVRDTVTSGQTAIDNLTESISVLQTGSAQIVQRMKTLGEFVGLAEQFVQDQGQIAQLTQVLALNATLVASRAAEQKDPNQFAGVAREFEAIAGQVNDLATQTNEGLTVLQQRTSQIQTVVSAIDAEVQSLSGLVSDFTTGVDSSQFAFHSIQIATEAVVQIGQTITDSSLEITEAAGSTAIYISEIAQLADRTADLTRAARQQAEAMGNQAQQLLQGIQFFRLPEGSSYATNSQNTESENLGDRPNAESKTEINNLFDAPPESVNTLANGNLEVPVVAVAAAATAVVISQSEQTSETYTASENYDNLDNTATDSQYLQSLLDTSIRGDSTDNGRSENSEVEVVNSIENLVSPSQEQNFVSTLNNLASENAFDLALDNVMPEDNAIQNFLDTPSPDEFQTLESELTDISVIEESLLADLRHEIYEELAESYEAQEQKDTNIELQEPHSTLENPLEGFNEFSIVEDSSDPLIVSATTSFIEDTAFGNISPLPEESLANLPTSFDFSIPDLDDQDFEIPKIDIKSTLDNSNSFFDASPVEPNNEVELTFDPFVIEQSTTETSDYDVDEAFTLDEQSENLNDNINKNISAELSYNLVEDLELSQFEDYNVDDFSVSPSTSYNEYASYDKFEPSLDEALEVTPNESFTDTFDNTFDKAPFDPAFGEALTSSNNVEPLLESNYDSFTDNTYDQVEISSSKQDYSFYDQFDTPVNLEANEQFTDLPSAYIEETNLEDSENYADLPNVIPDVYLEDVAEETLPDELEFDFQENLSAASSHSSLDESSNIFEEPSFEPTSEEASETNADFNDPFYVVDLPDLSEEEEFIEQQNYLFTEAAIASDTNIQDNFFDSPIEVLNIQETNLFDSPSDELYEEGTFELGNHEVDSNDLDAASFYQEREEFADNFELDNLTSQVNDFVPEIAIASEFDQQNPPTAKSSLDEASTEFNFDSFNADLADLSDEEFTFEDAITFDISQSEASPQVEIADLSSFTEDISEFAFPNFSDMNSDMNTDNVDLGIEAAIEEPNFAFIADSASHDQFADLPDPFSNPSSELAMPDFTGDALLTEDMGLDASDGFDDLNLNEAVQISLVETLLDGESAEDANLLTDDGVSIDNWDELLDLSIEDSSDDSFTVAQADLQDEISPESLDFLEETSEWEEEAFFDSLSTNAVGGNNNLLTEASGIEDLSIGEYYANLIKDSESDKSIESSYRFADSLLDILKDEHDADNDFTTSFPNLSIDNSAIPSELMTDMAELSMDMFSEGSSEDSESQFDFASFDELIDNISNPAPASIDSLDSDNITSEDATCSNYLSARAEIEDFLSGVMGLEDLDDEVSVFQDNISAKTEAKQPNPNKPMTNDKA
ncbi:MAG: methyl-accepting chemotaxis protein [Pseudanabaena sp.]